MGKGSRKAASVGGCNGKSAQSSANDINSVKADDTIDGAGSNNQFGSYLRSEDGMNTMKMFVIVNSIVMILTMGMPAMKQAYEIIYEKLQEWELI